jgi:hypothetical protein
LHAKMRRPLRRRLSSRSPSHVAMSRLRRCTNRLKPGRTRPVRLRLLRRLRFRPHSITTQH